jgi:hypothetical protein
MRERRVLEHQRLDGIVPTQSLAAHLLEGELEELEQPTAARGARAGPRAQR